MLVPLKRLLITTEALTAVQLEEIYQNHHLESDFSATLIRYLSDSKQQKHASWLLKKHLETGFEPDKTQRSEIYAQSSQLTDWEAKLHLLQSIRFIPISQDDKSIIDDFLRTCLSDKNKFVRAWAYSGFYELAVQHPEYRVEVEKFFQMALRDEAASIKARIRNIMKTGAKRWLPAL